MLGLYAIGLIWLVIGVFRFGKMNVASKLMYLWLSIFGLTHLFGPLWSYQFFDKLPIAQLYRKTMPIEQEEYFAFVQPAFIIAVLCSLAFGLFKPSDGWKLQAIVGRNPTRIVLFMLFFSFLGEFIGQRLGGTLSVVFWTMSRMYWVIPAFFFRINEKLLGYIGLIGAVLYSTVSGMFQESIMIALLTLMIFTTFFMNRKALIIFVPLGLSLLVGMLILKSTYRANEEKGVKGLISFYAESQSLGQQFFYGKNEFPVEGAFEINRRLNQGFLLAHAMKHTKEYGLEPSHLPLAYSSAVLPGFILPDKIDAGGKFNIERYTDINLQRGTSMNIGVLGDHFVAYRGWILWISWSFFCFLLFFTFRKVDLKIIGRSPFELFLPLWLFYTLKTETDIVSVVGHLFKIGLVLYLIYWAFARKLLLRCMDYS